MEKLLSGFVYCVSVIVNCDQLIPDVLLNVIPDDCCHWNAKIQILADSCINCMCVQCVHFLA